MSSVVDCCLSKAHVTRAADDDESTLTAVELVSLSVTLRSAVDDPSVPLRRPQQFSSVTLLRLHVILRLLQTNRSITVKIRHILPLLRQGTPSTKDSSSPGV